MSRTVLVTGATGFAGSFLVEHYTESGWSVHGTFRATPNLAPPGVSWHRLDLCNGRAVADLVDRVRPDLVHHLAAQSSVTRSWDDPMATLTENAGMQRNLLDAVALYCPEARVLVVGSCDEYGNVGPEENPVSEGAELRPANPYALSKVVQDLMGRQYTEVTGMHLVRVRPFLQIGPRRSDRFVSGSFARQVAEIASGRRESVLTVGTIDLERDFTDVRDVVRAYALAIEAGRPGEVYNIASGEGHTLREMVDCMLQTAGVTAEIRPDPALRRGREAPVLIGDASRLRDQTGWAPTFSFEQSVAATLEYWRDQVGSPAASRGGIT